jgi:hypothetical protein
MLTKEADIQKRFLAALVPVYESKRIDPPAFKIQENSPAPESEVVNL